MEFRAWIAVWICSRLLAIFLMIQGNNSAFAHNGAVENDVVSYWQARLHGAGMPTSVCSMISPLSSGEAAQFVISINASGGHYLPAHAAAFCKAARIQYCVQDGPQPERRSLSDQGQVKEGLSSSQNVQPEEGAIGTGNEGHVPSIVVDNARQKEVRKELNLPYFIFNAQQKELGKEYFPEEGSTEFGMASKTFSQAKPILGTHAPTERSSKAASRRLTGGRAGPVHIAGFYRERQVMVSGAAIYENFSFYNGDAEADRAFLPREVAKLFPLRNDGAEITRMLGVSFEHMEETFGLCKAGPDNKNAEVRLCLTSLEGVADFVWSILGEFTEDIDIYDGTINASRVQLEKPAIFHVLTVKALIDTDDPHVLCHDMLFPFSVFYCHYAKRTKLFQVTLQAEDGSTHERISVCHHDTSYWSPQHSAFSDLQTKPGESEACHWLGGTSQRQTGWAFVARGAAAVTSAAAMY